MLKYTETQVSFSEVPEEIALCINISGCPIHCKGCHSPHLWENIGKELDAEVLSEIIEKNSGVTCVAFMGGDAAPEEVKALAKWVKDNTELETCWYSGREFLNPFEHHYDYFDYVKIGPYKEDKGGLDKPTTNQRFYKVEHKGKGKKIHLLFNDITFKFRNNETNNKSESAD